MLDYNQAVMLDYSPALVLDYNPLIPLDYNPLIPLDYNPLIPLDYNPAVCIYYFSINSLIKSRTLSISAFGATVMRIESLPASVQRRTR